jgi:hypothetical protein
LNGAAGFVAGDTAADKSLNYPQVKPLLTKTNQYIQLGGEDHPPLEGLRAFTGPSYIERDQDRHLNLTWRDVSN